MASIPLYDSPASPDASHAMRAPGGYEWWYFDAEDRTTDTQIVAIFLHGFVFHPGYLRAHARFLRNPTRRPPVLADQYPCVYLCVYRKGRIAHQFMTQYRATDYHASPEQVQVRIGPNSLDTQDGGLKLSLSGTPWKLTWQGPQTLTDQTLKAELRFEPTFDHPPIERVFLSSQMTGAEHHWVIANPHCRVSGTINLIGKDQPPQAIDFSGVGYHDHNYGTGPLGPGLRRWIWGRAILDEQVLTFHYAVPRNRKLKDEIHLVGTSAGGIESIDVDHVESDWAGLSNVGLRYPRNLRFQVGSIRDTTRGSPSDGLILSNPRVIDAAPFYMRMVYDAQVDGRVTTAFCEVAYPHRLRYPILGRMIEMSIDKRACQ
jgi:carotenoid 1,2-hydratase